MAFSLGKSDLIKRGQVPEEGQPRHDRIPALFYRRAAGTGRVTQAQRPRHRAEVW